LQTRSRLALGTSANGLTSSILQSGYDLGPLRIVSARGRPAAAQQVDFSNLPIAFNMFGAAPSARATHGLTVQTQRRAKAEARARRADGATLNAASSVARVGDRYEANSMFFRGSEFAISTQLSQRVASQKFEGWPPNIRESLPSSRAKSSCRRRSRRSSSHASPAPSTRSASSRCSREASRRH